MSTVVHKRSEKIIGLSRFFCQVYLFCDFYRETHGTGVTYHEELAKQLASFVKDLIEVKLTIVLYWRNSGRLWTLACYCCFDTLLKFFEACLNWIIDIQGEACFFHYTVSTFFGLQSPLVNDIPGVLVKESSVD